MNLKQKDKNFLWHPLTQHKQGKDSLIIEKAQGCLLYDEDGNTYVDGISSWYISVYGHCNPYILKRVEAQMRQLDQVVFSGLSHKPAIELGEKLMSILPEDQEKIFFSDNGSTSVEVGVKLALQYHFNKGEKRPLLIAFEDGFHGDTFGSMSVSGLSVYNGPFEDFFLNVKRIPTPTDENINSVLSRIEELCEDNSVAAFVYEPLIQGAASMKMYKAGHLDLILKNFKKNGVITVADEVMTGFGKTGKHFASLHLETKPDIICMSKALTAGLLPMGVTSCSNRVFEAFLSDDLSKTFFHGHTYSANPLSCTAAIAGIELLTSEDIQQKIKRIFSWHREFDLKIKDHPKVKGTRQCGIIYAIDLDLDTQRYGEKRDEIYNFFIDRGVFLRPLGNTVYMHPPYIISEKEIQKIYNSIEELLNTI